MDENQYSALYEGLYMLADRVARDGVRSEPTTAPVEAVKLRPQCW